MVRSAPAGVAADADLGQLAPSAPGTGRCRRRCAARAPGRRRYSRPREAWSRRGRGFRRPPRSAARGRHKARRRAPARSAVMPFRPSNSTALDRQPDVAEFGAVEGARRAFDVALDLDLRRARRRRGTCSRVTSSRVGGRTSDAVCACTMAGKSVAIDAVRSRERSRRAHRLPRALSITASPGRPLPGNS